MSGTTFSRSETSLLMGMAEGYKPSYGHAENLPETWEEALAEEVPPKPTRKFKPGDIVRKIGGKRQKCVMWGTLRNGTFNYMLGSAKPHRGVQSYSFVDEHELELVDNAT